MNRFITSGLLAFASLVLAGAPAMAQYYPGNPYGGGSQFGGPGYRPTPPLSPYLNLVNNGNPALNYYLQVQPMFQRRVVEGQLESALRNVQQATPGLISGEIEALLRALQISEPLTATGHPVRFGDPSPYFNTRGTAGQLGSAYQPLPAAGRHPGR